MARLNGKFRCGSKIHGQGMFADADLAPGELMYCIPLDQRSDRPHPQWARLADNFFVNDELVLNWINHSCEPNSEIVNIQGDWYLRAVRAIKREDEITVDYNQTEIGGERLPCHCGSAKCRGYFLAHR
jgi:SET domain-containing protein